MVYFSNLHWIIETTKQTCFVNTFGIWKPHITKDSNERMEREEKGNFPVSCWRELFCFAFLRVIWQLKQIEYKPVTLLFLSERTWQQIIGFLSHLAHDGLLRVNRLYLQLHKQEGDLCRLAFK